MTNILRNSSLLSILAIGILSLLGYYFWTNLTDLTSKFLLLSSVFVVLIGIFIFYIFDKVKKAKNVYDKVLTALIGNILLNLLFIVALYFIVITFI